MADTSSAVEQKGWYDRVVDQLGQTAMQWLGEHVWWLPLLTLGMLVLVRLSGWHRYLFRGLAASVESLRQPGELTGAFPGTWASARAARLIGLDTAVPARQAMQAAQELLGQWFGPAIWSRQAFDKALVISLIYPMGLLLVLWVITGHGRLGTAILLPGDVENWRRVWLLLAVVAALVAWLAASRTARRRWTGESLELAESALRFVALVAFGAVALAVLVDLPGHAAGAVVGSAAFAGALAVAVAVFGAGVVAVGVVGAVFATPSLVVAIAFAAGDAGRIGNAVALSVGGAVPLAYFVLYERLLKRLRPRPAMELMAAVLGLMVMLAGALACAPHVVDASALRADALPFVALVFVGALPLWNAALDVISVGATRLFLRQYLARGHGWWWMVLLDVLIALLLTAVLFFGVFVLMHLMMVAGWGVDAGAMLAAFRRDPTGPEVNWVLWMALTNVLPTLLHLGLVSAGVCAGWLFRDDGFAGALRSGIQVVGAEAPTRSVLLGVDGHPMPTPPTPGGETIRPRLMIVKPLSPAQAQKLVDWVYVDFWLAAALPWCAAVAFWPLWQRGLHAILGWLT